MEKTQAVVSRLMADAEENEESALMKGANALLRGTLNDVTKVRTEKECPKETAVKDAATISDHMAKLKRVEDENLC